MVCMETLWGTYGFPLETVIIQHETSLQIFAVQQIDRNSDTQHLFYTGVGPRPTMHAPSIVLLSGNLKSILVVFASFKWFPPF